MTASGGEFALIQRYFTCASRRSDIILGIGDDAALLRLPAGHELVVTVDTLVAGVHFPPQATPASIGHKALAVNLSDLAAMGAQPAWVTLALTLPQADPAWLEGFAQGFFVLAESYAVELIGGDTTRGPLSITVQAMGMVPAGEALRRDGAQPGDLIFVTGTLGDAALGLDLSSQAQSHDDPHRAFVLDRLHRPSPRIQAGLLLRGIASAAIDISDGLVADLGHICARSGTGACIELAQLPCSASFLALTTTDARARLALSGGDDYELCFTVPPARLAQLEAQAMRFTPGWTCIGRIETGSRVRCLQADGREFLLEKAGYDHFRAP